MEKTINKVAEGLITFGNWSDFNKKVMLLSAESVESEEKLIQEMELDYERYKKIIDFSVRMWKSSPSKSLLNGIALQGVTLPKEGAMVFDSHLAQTRFLLMLIEGGLLGRFSLHTVKDEAGNKLRVTGEYALTYPNNEKREAVEKTVNNVLQYLYLYFFYCRKQEEKAGFKKPKKVYRGIRIGDILKSPIIKEALSEIVKEPFSVERRKREYDCIVRVLKEKGIHMICENYLVSFTSSKNIAKYFADNNGIIVEANTDEIEVMTSEVHDTRFAEKDWVSNKLEKEYIVRGKEGLMISDITISDLDYFIATNSPLAVSMFDHNNKSATYVLNGVRIKAYFVWTSNTTNTIRYINMDADSWGYSSKEFKDAYGFSPIISQKNLKDIEDFQIHIKR